MKKLFLTLWVLPYYIFSCTAQSRLDRLPVPPPGKENITVMKEVNRYFDSFGISPINQVRFLRKLEQGQKPAGQGSTTLIPDDGWDTWKMRRGSIISLQANLGQEI